MHIPNMILVVLSPQNVCDTIVIEVFRGLQSIRFSTDILICMGAVSVHIPQVVPIAFFPEDVGNAISIEIRYGGYIIKRGLASDVHIDVVSVLMHKPKMIGAACAPKDIACLVLIEVIAHNFCCDGTIAAGIIPNLEIGFLQSVQCSYLGSLYHI